MTKKQYGLSMLADTTTDHYPVKRRREKRRLDPNWAGIAWLEAEDLADTEIIEVRRDATSPELTVSRARGARRHECARPVFQILPIHTPSLSVRLRTERKGRACPDCDHWAYTSRCVVHTEVSGADSALSRSEAWNRRQLLEQESALPFGPPEEGWGAPHPVTEALADLGDRLRRAGGRVDVTYASTSGPLITITFDQEEQQ